jgi:hypothetical protein
MPLLHAHPNHIHRIIQPLSGHYPPTSSKIFKPLHPPDALDQLDPSAHLGPVDPLTVPAEIDNGPTEEEERIRKAREDMPGAEGMMLVQDFEDWGEKVLGGTGWNYYRSASDQEKSGSIPLLQLSLSSTSFLIPFLPSLLLTPLLPLSIFVFRH